MQQNIENVQFVNADCKCVAGFGHTRRLGGAAVTKKCRLRGGSRAQIHTTERIRFGYGRLAYVVVWRWSIGQKWQMVFNDKYPPPTGIRFSPFTLPSIDALVVSGFLDSDLSLVGAAAHPAGAAFPAGRADAGGAAVCFTRSVISTRPFSSIFCKQLIFRGKLCWTSAQVAARWPCSQPKRRVGDRARYKSIGRRDCPPERSSERSPASVMESDLLDGCSSLILR